MKEMSEQQHPPPQIPNEWMRETPPDGETRLRRRRLSTLHVIGIVVGFAFSIPFLLLGLREGDFLGLLETVAVAGCLVTCIMKVFGREEWRIRPNSLEVQQTLFGQSLVRRYTDASLELTYLEGESRGWWCLQVALPGEARTLVGGTLLDRRPLKYSELLGFASFLAERTGWPLRVPDS